MTVVEHDPLADVGGAGLLMRESCRSTGKVFKAIMTSVAAIVIMSVALIGLCMLQILHLGPLELVAQARTVAPCVLLLQLGFASKGGGDMESENER